MATNKTTNYGLNQWVKSDEVVMADFNGDNQKLDAALTSMESNLSNLESNLSNVQIQLNGKAASSHGTHVTYSTTAPVVAGTASVGTAATVSRSDHVHPAQTTVSGNAGSATKLATARTIRTNLASTSTASFNGTANVTPGVTGVLPVANGGTGTNSLSTLATNLNSTAGLAKIATGSYTGVDTYGKDHPVTLTFPFAPKIIFLTYSSYDYYFCNAQWAAALFPGSTKVQFRSTSFIPITWSADGKTVSWYDTSNASNQLNSTTTTVTYIAIG